MLAAASRLVPLAAKFIRQIVPPVIATLIAAGLISAYNRAFSGHLQQPRMAALHQASAPAEAVTISTSKPLTGTEPVALYGDIAPPPRLWDKEAGQDAGKDAIKLAEPAAAPVRTAAPREKAEPRVETRRVAAIEPAPPVMAPVVAPTAPAPVVAALPTVQELRQPVLPPPYAQPHNQPPYAQPQSPLPATPPPVITAQPIVTVPDRPRPIEQAQADPPAPPQGAFGRIVDTLKPSSLFARAREFGERIEQAGNDILPSIRQ